jgi:hypothetical protein
MRCALLREDTGGEVFIGELELGQLRPFPDRPLRIQLRRQRRAADLVEARPAFVSSEGISSARLSCPAQITTLSTSSSAARRRP